MRAATFLVCLMVLTVTSIALAQPAPKPLAQTLQGDAKAAYEAGKLLFGDGDYAGAEIKFKAAYDTSNDARLLWNMAACEKSQRHYARTDSLVREYLDKGGPLLGDQDKADAKALLDLIDSFTVKLTVNVDQPDAVVTIDETEVGKSPLSKPIVVDIGTRKIVVHKEGFKEWTQPIPVGGSATATVDVKLEVQLQEGSLHVTTQEPDAEIRIDGQVVGKNRFDGKVKSGGHTLRISAPGMLPYQTEVVIYNDENRTIDIPPLERQPVPLPPPKPKFWMPHAATAFSIATGADLHAGAALFDLRVEYGWKPGWPTEINFFTDVGTLDPSNNCGSKNFHGPNPDPTVLTDFAIRYAFQACYMLRLGFLFGLHFTPRSKFDVYTSVEVGVHAVVSPYKSYDPLTQQSGTGTAVQFSVLDVGGRIGVDYHPFLRQPPGEKKQSAAARWGIGGFVSFVGAAAGAESDNNQSSCGQGVPCNDNNKGTKPYPWLLLFGARTSLKF